MDAYTARRGAGLIFFACLLFCPFSSSAATPYPLPVCLYVSSYHQGYTWSDGIERALRATLEGHCRIVQFDMNTKRRKREVSIRAAAGRAYSLIESLQPAVVITSDDNAVKFLIVPYLMNTTTPVVFSGVNWTVEEYGLPVANVTGIVEVAPLRPMLQHALALSQGGYRGMYLSSDTLTSKKNYAQVIAMAETLGIAMTARFVDSMGDWAKAVRDAQAGDFLILGNHAGIPDWNPAMAEATATSFMRRPALTNDEWMMPFAHIGYTKISEEQGVWAGRSAIAILEGRKPSDIALVTGRQWDVWLNERLLSTTGLKVSARLRRKAKRID